MRAPIAVRFPVIEDDDAALLRSARAGDREAVDALLRRHYDKIHAICRRLTGDDSDSADATQEALIAIVRGLPRFEGKSRFGTWAYRVATNACLDEMRRRKRRPQPGLPEYADVGSDPPLDVVVAGRIDIDRALARLPMEFRAAVVLRDIAGLDYAEIGQILGIPPGTVRSRIARGRAALVPHLGRNSAAAPERPTE